MTREKGERKTERREKREKREEKTGRKEREREGERERESEREREREAEIEAGNVAIRRPRICPFFFHSLFRSGSGREMGKEWKEEQVWP